MTIACPPRLFIDHIDGFMSGTVSAMAVAGDDSIEDRHCLVAERERADGTDWLRMRVSGPKLPVALVDQAFERR